MLAGPLHIQTHGPDAHALAGTRRPEPPAPTVSATAAEPQEGAKPSERTNATGADAAAGDQRGRTGESGRPEPEDGEERQGEESARDGQTAEHQEIAKLEARDRQVRAHEQAHLAAAGGVASGGPSFSYTVGPDGRRYAVGGEVQIDTSPVPGDPAATIAKAQRIRRAALAPADPSAQDMRVAAQALGMEQEARAELAVQSREAAGQTGDGEDGTAAQPAGNGRSEKSAGACPLCGGDHGQEAHADAARRQITSAIEVVTRAGTPAAGSALDDFA